MVSRFLLRTAYHTLLHGLRILPPDWPLIPLPPRSVTAPHYVNSLFPASCRISRVVTYCTLLCVVYNTLPTTIPTVSYLSDFTPHLPQHSCRLVPVRCRFTTTHLPLPYTEAGGRAYPQHPPPTFCLPFLWFTSILHCTLPFFHDTQRQTHAPVLYHVG